MSMLPPVVGELKLKASQASASIKKVGAETKTMAAEATTATGKFGAGWNAASKATTIAGTAIMGGAALVGYHAVKMATDFQTSTARLVTSAGESDSALSSVRNGILNLSGELGVSATDMSNAMYMVESAGYHGSAGLGVLKAAEQGAKAEGADGAKVADALSSALRDYYPHAQSAADVTKASSDTMSKLIAATSAGKMTFDSLSGSLNSILPVASAAHVSLNDTLGVLAAMTVHGISADEATQNMADAIRHLQAPTQTMSKEMAALGIDSTDVAQKLGERGLSGTMQYLSEKVKAAMPPGTDKVILDLGNALSKSTPQVQALGQKLMDGSITMGEFTKAAKALDPISAGQATAFETLAKSTHQLGNKMLSGEDVLATYGGTMAKVMGDATGLKVALMTTGENSSYTASAIKTVSDATADAQGNVKGWSEVQKNAGQSLSELKATVEAVGIKIGTAMLPYVKKAADALTQWLTKIQSNQGALKALGIAAMSLFAVPVLAAIIKVGQGLVKITQGFIALGKGMVAGVRGGIHIIQGIPGMLDTVRLRAMYAGDAFRKVGSTIANLGKGFGSAISSAAQWAASVTKSAAQAIASIAKTTAMWVAQTAKVVAAKAAQIAMSVATKAAAAAQWLLNAAMNANPIGLVVAAIVLLVGGLILAYNKIGWFKDFVNSAWSLIQTVVADVVNWIVGTAFPMFMTGIQVIGTIVDWLWNTVIYPDFNLIRQIITGVVNFITGVVAPGIRGAFDAIGATVINAVGFLQAFGNNVASVIGNVLSTIGSLPGRIQGFFADAGSWLINAGSQIIGGLVSGIEGAIGGAVSAVSNAVGGIVGGIKGLLGIHSPSRVMADEVGVPMAQGIAMGIVNARSTVVTALGSVTNPQGITGITSSSQYAANVSAQQNTPAMPSAGMGRFGGQAPIINVYVTTNADPHQIATEMAFQLQLQS